MEVQYLLEEMAFKTQSNRRTKSSSNLLQNKKDEQSLQQVSQVDNVNSLVPSGRLNTRVFSTMDLLQPRIIKDIEA